MNSQHNFCIFPRLLPFLPTLLIFGIAGCGGSGSSSSGSTSGSTGAGAFVENKLVSDQTGVATLTDPNLKNPWGMSYSPGGVFSGSATIRPDFRPFTTGPGKAQGLVVAIPAAGGGANGPVTGQVYNSTSDFSIPGAGGAFFIFDSEDGLITAWGGGATATTVADRSFHWGRL